MKSLTGIAAGILSTAALSVGLYFEAQCVRSQPPLFPDETPQVDQVTLEALHAYRTVATDSHHCVVVPDDKTEAAAWSDKAKATHPGAEATGQLTFEINGEQWVPTGSLTVGHGQDARLAGTACDAAHDLGQYTLTPQWIISPEGFRVKIPQH